ADVAVYGAKLQGRNRVLSASSEASPPAVEPRVSLDAPAVGRRRLPVESTGAAVPSAEQHASTAQPQRAPTPFPVSLSIPLAAFVTCVGALGLAAGAAGLVLGRSDDLFGMAAMALLVGVGQLFALEVPDGSISVSAVGALAGAALFGPEVALAL